MATTLMVQEISRLAVAECLSTSPISEMPVLCRQGFIKWTRAGKLPLLIPRALPSLKALTWTWHTVQAVWILILELSWVRFPATR